MERFLHARIRRDFKPLLSQLVHLLNWGAGRLGKARQLCLALVLVICLPDLSQASDTTRVLFDVNYLVECRTVTSPEFAAANPNEDLVEARLRVSSLIQYGREEDLLQFIYQARSPEKSVRVVDAFPKTTLTTSYAGNVDVEKNREAQRQFDLNVSGQYPGFIKGDASAHAASKQSEQLQYELLPPMELLAASGTIERGFGAYFKLKPSPRTSLEGANDFLLVLRVPRQWRGDYMVVRCQALGTGHSLVPAAAPIAYGQGKFLIALYREGDDQAKSAADRLVRAEFDLRRAVELYREEIEKLTYPTVVHRVGQLLDVLQPQPGESWLDQFVYQPARQRPPQLVQELPKPVRAAAADFVSAKLQLQRLSAVQSLDRTYQERNHAQSSATTKSPISRVP